MRRNENIISDLQNITPHFTGKAKIITLVLAIIILSFSNITLSSSNIFNSPNVSALSYQGSTEVKFTFNPTLSINISSSNLTIDNLTPGTTSDSNVINVSVATNASHGYTLSATVGDSLHNNANLTHTNDINTFSSIATNSSLPSLTTDNTWGYSYRLPNNSSSTWSNYSGLSNETSKTLINTDNQTAKPIDFKIAAKASSTQPSGTYTNTINFIAISKSIPKTIEDIAYMQTFGELVETDLQSVKDSMIKNTTYALKDARDEQAYTVAKLEDGKIWMTKNLNLAGGTTLSSNDTDFEASYILPTTNGWNTTDNNSKLVMPTSSASGFSTDNYAYLYNSNSVACVGNSPCYSYYSWDTATLGSSRDIGIDNQNAPYSICPKGWHLPSTYKGVDNLTDFRALMIAYGGSNSIQTYNGSTNPTGADIYNLIKFGTTPNFISQGFYLNSSFYGGGSSGRYWSSTSSNSTVAKNLVLDSVSVYSADSSNHRYGFSVRCLAR